MVVVSVGSSWVSSEARKPPVTSRRAARIPATIVETPGPLLRRGGSGGKGGKASVVWVAPRGEDP
jgi:hypothetical protein